MVGVGVWVSEQRSVTVCVKKKFIKNMLIRLITKHIIIIAVFCFL